MSHSNSFFFTFLPPHFQDYIGLLNPLLLPAGPFSIHSAILAGKSSFSHPPPLSLQCSETTVVGMTRLRAFSVV